MNIRNLIKLLAGVALVAAISISAAAQNRGTLRGQVSDEFGASIVGATVTLTDAAGTAKTATTGPDGNYSFTGLTAGKYKVHAASAGFATSEDTEIDVAANRREPLNFTLKIAAIETQVKVNSDTPISTDANNNANQQVLSGKDLDALPDDPDELAAALQALAGPTVGPSGGQIFIDGFSGGNMPPKEAIREIRIQQNPFAPENDQPSGRIDILTRPGTDKFRGAVNFNFQDESLNSRNPFAVSSSKRSPYQQRQFGGSISGPIVKRKASFFFEANRNETDDNDLIRATILNSALQPVDFGLGALVPRRNTNISPRLDYAINSRNTLVARYNFFKFKGESGLGNFNLPQRRFKTESQNHNLQLTETAVLNAFTINETRFQFNHSRNENLGNSTIPVLNVSSAFNGCLTASASCSQVGHAINTRTNWELNNFTQIQRGMHTFKFGGRVRGVRVDDLSPNNAGGQWIFSGGFGPADFNNPVAGTIVPLTSLERYRRTLFIAQNGLNAAQQTYCGSATVVQCVRTLGGGASQFSINTGNFAASVSQVDVGFYWQDDWRVRPNFTLSYGLRYENQQNIHSKFNFAPRLGFAWSPGAANATKPPKTVIRGGGGLFYNRFGEGSTLTANRFNGSNELQFAIPEVIIRDSNGIPRPPTAAEQTANQSFTFLNQFPTIPTSAQLATIPANQQTIWRVAPNLQAPMVTLAGIQVERQLPKNITAFAGLFHFRISHVIRARDINAPLPGTISPTLPSGIRPNPALGDIYQYESSGKYRQTAFSVGFNSRLNPRVSLQGGYNLGWQRNDTDGQGSGLFPLNSYNLTGEYGRGSGDVRHRFNLIGTFNSPWWKLQFNPFIVANSGPPFNIITGEDSNLDRQFTERPTFAALNTYCTSFPTRCKGIDYSSTSSDIIPRNFGKAPGALSVNLRISRTFGFGGEANRSASNSKPNDQKGSGDSAANKRGGSGSPRGGPMVPSGMGGAKGPGGPGGPQMMVGGPGGGPSAPAKYNLTLSVNFQNILNHVNLGTPVGSLTSPLFGQSTSLGGSFGFFGPGGGFGGGGGGAGNRRVTLSARFTF
jgi:hypothetical protein